jgi:hypothetical protein
MCLIRQMNTLNERAAEQIEYVEPYAYGDESRRQWDMLGQTHPCDEANTGIPGTAEMGLNTHQRLWIYFNGIFDEEDAFERRWNVGQFVASAFNAKGVKKASKKVKSKLDDIEERRQIIYEGKGDVTFDQQGRIEVVSESPDELIDQMERTIEGKKDFHDRVVEAYEKRIREQHQKKQQRRQQAREAMEAKQRKMQRREADDEADLDPYDAYDPEEVEQLQQEERQRIEESQEDRDPNPHRRDRVADRYEEYGVIPDRDEDLDEAYRHPFRDDNDEV